MSERPEDEAAVSWCIRLSQGDLYESEQKELRAWLALDPLHRQRMDMAVTLWEGIENDAHAPEMLPLRRQALAAVQRAGARRWSRAKPRQWTWLAVAAALLLVVGVTFLSRDPTQRYVTGIGDLRTIALSDGSTVVLDSDSALAVNFSEDRRDLTLERGRASFKVAKNPLRPFAVTSGQHMVVATGTAFSVERLANEIRVSLFEGHVAVLRGVSGGQAVQLTKTGGARLPAEQALTPGHELIVPDGERLGVLQTSSPSDTVGGGQLSFTNEPLAIAAERVNRYSVEKRIHVGAGAADIRISGVFNAGDADAFARGVAAVFPVRVANNGNAILLTPQPVDVHTN